MLQLLVIIYFNKRKLAAHPLQRAQFGKPSNGSIKRKNRKISFKIQVTQILNFVSFAKRSESLNFLIL